MSMPIFHLNLSMHMSGAERQMYYLVKSQQEKFSNELSKFQPMVLCIKDSLLAIELKKHNIEVLELPNTNYNSPILYYFLNNAIKRHKPAILHAHENNASNLLYFYQKFINKNIKSISTVRTMPAIKSTNLKKYSNNTAIACVTNEIANTLKAAGIEENKVQTIYSAIEPNFYQKKQKREDNRFIFVSVGSLISQNNFEHIIEAAHIIEKMQLDNLQAWEVRIIGKGENLQNLIKLAEDNEVLTKFAFLGSQDNIEILPHCDSLITTSALGEYSLTIIKQAFAVGLPVICINSPANLEQVENKKTALVVSNNNAEALAGAMLSIMQEEHLRMTLIDNASKSLDNYSIDIMQTKYETLYNDLIK